MESRYHIVKKTVHTFYFIGVTTGKSSIMTVFPCWMEAMGRSDIVLDGIDCKIHDDREVYRQAVAQIRNDPLSIGALVTTHKIDLLTAARDMFDYLDSYAQICNEVSSISKLDGRLEGHAKDPISAGLSLDAIIGDNYFEKTGGDVLCFGAGGSAIATLLHLINKENKADRPGRFIFINRSQSRLDNAKDMVKKIGTDIEVLYICNSDPQENNKWMGGLPQYSIVINATGMGKDTPGSPITWEGQFPQNGIAWDFNYRGELDFLKQAAAQHNQRNLLVEDGWLYFIHGWTQVIAQVLHINLDAELFRQLDLLASQFRNR